MEINLENLGTVNKNKISLSKPAKREGHTRWLELFFSYSTCVSFACGYTDTGFASKVTRQNDWSVTTGKFLNEIEPDKSKRVSGEEFEKLLEEALSEFEK